MARRDLALVRLASAFLLIAGLTLARGARAADLGLVPRIEGEWWQISGNPDLGKFTTDRQQPVDFAIWQAADGTWQLWSCIRSTAHPVSSGITSVIAMIPRLSSTSTATARRCRPSSVRAKRSGLSGGGVSVMAHAAR